MLRVGVGRFKDNLKKWDIFKKLKKMCAQHRTKYEIPIELLKLPNHMLKKTY